MREFAAPACGGRPPMGQPIDGLFLGRMTALKGPDVALRAASHASASLGRPISVVLAGDGPDRPALERRARELGGGGQLAVAFPGWVDAPAREALLSRASLVVVPSIWPEPFGLVGLEAAQFGVPAVAFAVGGIGEWLADDVNGCAVPASAGAAGLGRAIARVLGDRATHARLGSGARAAASRMSADAHVAQLERVLTTSIAPSEVNPSPGTF